MEDGFIQAMNSITSSQYGFQVFDWDMNRGEGEKAGKILIGKPGWLDLSGCDNNKIACIFHKQILECMRIEINGKKYIPKSIHIRGDITEMMFLFILGNEVDSSLPT